MKPRILCLGVLVVSVACNASSGTDTSDTATTYDPVARGEYLVRHVAACGTCHTPLNSDGTPDDSRFLGGRDHYWFHSTVSAPNLTDDETGLATWTDAEIIDAFKYGIRIGGTALGTPMPYFAFANLDDEDTLAILAYLRTVTPVSHPLPSDQPIPGDGRDAPYSAIAGDLVTQTTLTADDADYASAERGRYLASFACLGCHSPNAPDRTWYKKDVTMLFSGNTGFSHPDGQGGYTDPIHAWNLTPDEHGLGGWSAQDIADLLLTGEIATCRPMQAGPNGAFGGMTLEDALDIGTYLTTIPAIATDAEPDCVPGG